MSETKSGLYWPNAFALFLLQAMEKSIGKTELNSLLAAAGLEQYIEHYPPHNPVREIDFADITALRTALNGKYGLRGGDTYAVRIGRLMFVNFLLYSGQYQGHESLAVVPPNVLPMIVAPGIAHVLSNFSDQVSTATEEDDHLTFSLERCPFCWQQKAARPMCQIMQGILHDGLSRFTRKHMSGDRFGKYHYRIQIASCIATGDDMGRLDIYKMPIDILG